MTTESRPLRGHLCPLRSLASIVALLLVGLPACKGAGEDARECNVHADCASGVCLPDGTCGPVEKDDGGDKDATDDVLDGSQDGDEDAVGPDAEDALPGVCKPNGDGTITAAEMPFGPDLTAMFRISQDVPYPSQPDCSSGTCQWDLVELGGVTTETASVTVPLEGKWYAQLKGFENATYASRMTEFKLGFGGMTVCDQVQFGVFQVNEFGLFLLGVVSEFAVDGTALVYDKPVPMLVFPMSLGTTWTVETVARGPLCNSLFDYAISQTYTSEVDRAGRVRTPYGDFDNVLRVNTLMERHVGVGVTATKMVTHTYVAECFTTIASAMSPEGKADAEFTTAAEVRRLTNLP